MGSYLNPGKKGFQESLNSDIYKLSLEKETLQKIMDNFSISTELSVVAVNMDGEAFLSSTQYEENEFCRYIQSSKEGRRRCEKCYKKACKEAFKWDEPYFFRCHAGLVMWASPLQIDQKNKFNWRNMVLSQIRERKKAYEHTAFDRSVYLKRERNFLQYVSMEDRKKIVEMFPILYTDMEILSGYDRAEAKRIVRDFMVLVSRACAEAGLEAELAQQMLRQYEKETERLKNSEEIYAVSYGTICNYLDMIFQSGEDSHTGLIRSVTDYIRQNFGQEISLEDIAGHVSLSKSYLCALFKENMNMTVNDYLTRVRVEKSIELMKNRAWSVGEIGNSLLEGNAEKTDGLVHKALGKLYPAEMILERGLMGGIKKMEEKFQSMSMFVPDALLAARALNIGLESLRPYLKQKNGYKCTAILGTVEGDYHDIGKNLVRIYVSTLEIKVIDLGVDVSKEEFVQAIRKHNARILLLSALLTTTIKEMELVIKELEKEGLRDQVSVFVGGLPVTKDFAQSIGADYYTRDALALRDFLGKNLDRLLK